MLVLAALLLLLLTVGSLYFNNEEGTPVNNVVESDDAIKPEVEENKIFNDSNKTEVVITNNDSQDDLEPESQTKKASDKITPSIETSVA